MRLQKITLAVASLAVVLGACKKDKDPVIIIPPSTGSTIELNGIAASEAGSSAGNSVYLDLSRNAQVALLRSSWDLGFYGGNEFRVKLNNTTSAAAKVTTKTDLSAVGSADTVGVTLAISQATPSPTHFNHIDKLDGSLAGTVIPEISATAAENKVIIINRGTGGGIAARAWFKVKITRNASNGYTVQYGELNATTFQTVNITKNADYLFQLFSFDNGVLANGEPEKGKWDLVWSYSVFETNFGVMVPYNFSDLIAINNLGGVQAREIVYTKTATQDSTVVAAAAYIAFNKDSVNKYTPSNDRWVIGSGWRSTQPAIGARMDRFYLIKDAAGNFYKLKCLSMGVGADGGTRGKPNFQYALIP